MLYETSSNISLIWEGLSTGVETGWEELRESTSMALKHLSRKKSSYGRGEESTKRSKRWKVRKVNVNFPPDDTRCREGAI